MRKSIIMWAAASSIGLGAVMPAVAQDNIARAKDIIESALSGQPTGNDVIGLSFLVLNPDGSAQMPRSGGQPFYTGERMRVRILPAQSGTLQLININSQGKSTPFRQIPVQAGVPAFYPPEQGNTLEFANVTGQEILRVVFNPTPGTMPAIPVQPQQPNTVNPTFPVQLPTPVSPVATDNPLAALFPVSPQTDSPILLPGMTAGMSQASNFFSGVTGKAYVNPKDIREVVVQSSDATYITRPSGTGAIQFDVTIQHRN